MDVVRADPRQGVHHGAGLREVDVAVGFAVLCDGAEGAALPGGGEVASQADRTVRVSHVGLRPRGVARGGMLLELIAVAEEGRVRAAAGDPAFRGPPAGGDPKGLGGREARLVRPDLAAADDLGERSGLRVGGFGTERGAKGHKQSAEHVLALTAAAVDAPEHVSPGVAFDEPGVPRGEELGPQLGVGELAREDLGHDLDLHPVPAGAAGEVSAELLGLRGRLGCGDAAHPDRVVRLGELVGGLRRWDAQPAPLDLAWREVAEEPVFPREGGDKRRGRVGDRGALAVKPRREDVAVTWRGGAGPLAEAAEPLALEGQDALPIGGIGGNALVEVRLEGREAVGAVVDLPGAPGAGRADGMGIAKVPVGAFSGATDVDVIRLADVHDDRHRSPPCATAPPGGGGWCVPRAWRVGVRAPDLESLVGEGPLVGRVEQAVAGEDDGSEAEEDSLGRLHEAGEHPEQVGGHGVSSRDRPRQGGRSADDLPATGGCFRTRWHAG